MTAVSSVSSAYPASGERSIRFHGDAPAIVCGECGFRTARVASLLDSAGRDAGTVVVCVACQERERAHAASAARRAAERAARQTVLPRGRRAPVTRTVALPRTPRRTPGTRGDRTESFGSVSGRAPSAS
ncbi:hypothetical protein SaccyDRAFT_2079 [Saccharomonospora cyanea NA-134]|uniref:Uncharacterized protein n=1 Tax=Saccharomonospora cyanea NA-134 TaxID=882082 RepID=H5XLS3_9PSEU|nr:hypothetical protein SaccyDRAFT_2079 [Saccharomonospora cyanea NA-134]